MPRPRLTTPTYRRHSPTGMALADFRDPLTGEKRCVTLGPWQSAESLREHARLCAEVATGKLCGTPLSGGVTVAELCLGYLAHAEGYYRKNGEMTDEVDAVRAAVKVLRELHGPVPVNEFAPRSLVAVQNAMIGRGWCRTTINKQLARVRRVFRWGVAEQLVEPDTLAALAAVPALKAGRSAAREKAKVTAVADAIVDRTLPHLSDQVRAMVQLQRLCGTRPGEVVILRPGDVDRSRKVWVYRPHSFKTEHLGGDRHIPLGPRAQKVLRPFLDRPPEAYCFSPKEAVAALRAKQRAARAARGGGSGGNRKSPAASPERAPRDRYCVDSYRQAVQKACRKAGVPAWHPNQLRHAAAAEIREKFDLERARATLGHTQAGMTAHYAQSADGRLAAEVAERIG